MITEGVTALPSPPCFLIILQTEVECTSHERYSKWTQLHRFQFLNMYEINMRGKWLSQKSPGSVDESWCFCS